MKTVHLDNSELAMLRNAVRSQLHAFGHNESEVVERAKHLLRKLDEAEDDDVESASKLIG